MTLFGLARQHPTRILMSSAQHKDPHKARRTLCFSLSNKSKIPPLLWPFFFHLPPCGMGGSWAEVCDWPACDACGTIHGHASAQTLTLTADKLHLSGNRAHLCFFGNAAAGTVTSCVGSSEPGSARRAEGSMMTLALHAAVLAAAAASACDSSGPAGFACWAAASIDDVPASCAAGAS